MFLILTFFRYLELDRDKLFEKAGGEVLNKVINLSLVAVKDWEEKLSAELWKGISHNIFENVYLSTSYTVNQTNSTGNGGSIYRMKY